MNNNKDKKWKGYTLDELRYLIVVNRISFDVERQRMNEIGRIAITNPFSLMGWNSIFGYLKKIMSVLAYFDAVVKIVKRLREIFK